MKDLYERVPLTEGTLTQFVGVHVMQWQWDRWGEPTAAFIEVEPDDKDATITALRAEVAALKAQLAAIIPAENHEIQIRHYPNTIIDTPEGGYFVITCNEWQGRIGWQGFGAEYESDTFEDAVAAMQAAIDLLPAKAVTP